MESLRSVSVVVPVYNSEATLPALVERLAAALPQVAARYELILVNDGSRDRSWAVVGELARRHGWVHGIDLVRNFGQHNALLAGIRAARCEVIVTMDDDLQNPPEEIHQLLDELDRGWDVVYGSSKQVTHSLTRRLASRLTRLSLQSAIGVENAKRMSTFRAFRTHLRDAFADYASAFISIDVLLTWATSRFSAVDVRHEPRAAGESTYTLWKLVTHALNMLTGFSTLPLQLASWIGFGFTLFGGLVLVWVIGRYLLQGAAVPGFAFLASIIALFSGAQLFAIGVIGEYLARMHFRLMGRPAYVVRSRTEHAAPAAAQTSTGRSP